MMATFIDLGEFGPGGWADVELIKKVKKIEGYWEYHEWDKDGNEVEVKEYIGLDR